MDADPVIDAATVDEWIAKSENHLGAARQALAEAQARVRELEERLETLRKLRPRNSDVPAERSDEERARALGELPEYRRELVAHAVELLEDVGHPMTIRDIHQAFQERGWPIGGKGEPVNIIFALRQSNGIIVAPSRGVYALPEQLDSGEAAANTP